MIMYSDSIFVNYHADCQESFAYLSQTQILPKNIYVSVPITYENNTFKLVNPSNLQINYEWENINSPDEKYIEFKPMKGVLEPKSEVLIFYKMIFYSSNKKLK